jgi:hypothetical protein
MIMHGLVDFKFKHIIVLTVKKPFLFMFKENEFSRVKQDERDDFLIEWIL